MFEVFNIDLEGFMPFIAALSQNKKLLQVEGIRGMIEDACKRAWVSMGDGFEKTDVTGVLTRVDVLLPTPNSIQLDFYYVDRGYEFNETLYQRLRQELGALIAEVGFGPTEVFSPNVILVPTKTEDWFEEPNWSRG